MFAPLYICPEHGQIWNVEHVEFTDAENDEIYKGVLCAQCHRDVLPAMQDGKPVYHALSEEELEDIALGNLAADDEDDAEEEGRDDDGWD